MSEYVELSKLQKFCREYTEADAIGLILAGRTDLLHTIPAIPLEQQKTGYWIDDCPMVTDEGLVRVIRCSCCNEQRKDYYGISKNYCPNCGAKMKSEG